MTQLELTLKCHKIVKGFGKGEAIVSKDPICFYLTDPKTGVVTERGHALEGKNLAKKVLVMPAGKGSSVVQVDGLFKLAQNKVAPKAMIVQDVETVLVTSAVIAEVPLVDRLEKNPFETIKSGDFVKVNADTGIVTITKHSSRETSP